MLSLFWQRWKVQQGWTHAPITWASQVQASLINKSELRVHGCFLAGYTCYSVTGSLSTRPYCQNISRKSGELQICGRTKWLPTNKMTRRSSSFRFFGTYQNRGTPFILLYVCMPGIGDLFKPSFIFGSNLHVKCASCYWEYLKIPQGHFWFS